MNTFREHLTDKLADAICESFIESEPQAKVSKKDMDHHFGKTHHATTRRIIETGWTPGDPIIVVTVQVFSTGVLPP